MNSDLFHRWCRRTPTFLLANFVAQIWLDVIIEQIAQNLSHVPDKARQFLSLKAMNSRLTDYKGYVGYEKLILGDIEAKKLTVEKFELFKQHLISISISYLEQKKSNGFLWLTTDYGPEGILADAWIKADLPRDSWYLLPIKSNTSWDPRTKEKGDTVSAVFGDQYFKWPMK